LNSGIYEMGCNLPGVLHYHGGGARQGLLPLSHLSHDVSRGRGGAGVLVAAVAPTGDSASDDACANKPAANV